MQARTIETSAGPIEFAQCGAGPPVVLVHGTPGSWRQAASLALDLAEHHTVVLPSRPGYGATPVSTGPTPAAQARAYAALLDALDLPSAGIVGISGGGPSAAQFAHHFPERTTSLVLCCALAPHLTRPPAGMRIALGVPGLAEVGGRVQRWRERRALADAAATDRRLTDELTPAEAAQLEADPRLRDELVGFLWSHLDAPAPSRGLRNDLRSMGFAPEGAAPDLGAVRAPTRVLHGDADGVVPVDHGRFYASAIDGAELEVLPGAGHAFLLTFRSTSLDSLRVALAVA